MQYSENKKKEQECVRLLSAHYVQIKSFIFCMLPNASDVDDVMQETSVAIWSKSNDYELGTDFVAWAVTIAKYKVFEFRRKNHHNLIALNDNVLDLLEKENTSLLSNTKERTQALMQCIKKLSSQDQEFIKLKYAEGFTLKKLAQRFGYSVSSIYRNSTRIHGLLLGCIHRIIKQEL